MQYNFQSGFSGNTSDATIFRLKINTVAVDLTGAIIRMCLKSQIPNVGIVKEFSTENGTIILSDPGNGEFTILPSLMDIAAGVYCYDIQIHELDGKIKTYVEGVWKILPAVTV